jgi:hypothetical protein
MSFRFDLLILDILRLPPCLPSCHWALQNQPLMGASKPAEVWMFSKWSEAGFEDSQNCREPVF